ncbi:MAG: hypothetical protein HN608_21960, partial [Rhodospirillaceae bacterium]|nr:hypothetical protein [Rhodospirillaceae bacterium]
LFSEKKFAEATAQYQKANDITPTGQMITRLYQSNVRSGKSADAQKTLTDWLAAIGADKLINRRGTTWRELTEGQKGATGDALVSLLLEQPAILKRPIFVTNDGVSVGFDEAQKQNLAT